MALDLSNMTVTRAPAEPEAEPVVDRRPVITEEIRAENFRRAKFPALVHVNADGTRSWKHDIVKHGDGIIDTQSPGFRSTDTGDGSSRDSIKLLAKEGTVEVDGLLPLATSESPARDASGRFVSNAE